MFLKEQEESLETLSFKTFYYTFPIINCQKLASGQRILSFVYTQAKTLFYLPKLQDFLCAELNLKPWRQWDWSAAAASARKQFGLCYSGSEQSIAMDLKVCCRASTAGVTLWWLPFASVWQNGPCNFTSSGCSWWFGFQVSFTLQVKSTICSTSVKDEITNPVPQRCVLVNPSSPCASMALCALWACCLHWGPWWGPQWEGSHGLGWDVEAVAGQSSLLWQLCTCPSSPRAGGCTGLTQSIPASSGKSEQTGCLSYRQHPGSCLLHLCLCQLCVCQLFCCKIRMETRRGCSLLGEASAVSTPLKFSSWQNDSAGSPQKWSCSALKQLWGLAVKINLQLVQRPAAPGDFAGSTSCKTEPLLLPRK